MTNTFHSHESTSPNHPLTRIIDHLAHLLPTQRPINIFIHHNTLHTFEKLPFETTIEHATDELSYEPFLPETRYRDKLASDRILAKDVDAVLREQLGTHGDAGVAGTNSHLDLWR